MTDRPESVNCLAAVTPAIPTTNASQHGDIKHALPHPSHNLLAIHIPAPTISTSASFPSKPWMVSTSNRHRIHWRQQMASCCTVSFIISLAGVVTTVSLVCYHRRLLQCHNIYCNSELLSERSDCIVWIQGVFEASHTVRPRWTNGPLGWPRLRTFPEFIVLVVHIMNFPLQTPSFTQRRK